MARSQRDKIGGGLENAALTASVRQTNGDGDEHVVMIEPLVTAYAATNCPLDRPADVSATT